MNICLFTQEELGRPLSVRDGRAAHILKVLRKTEGDSFAAGVVGGAAGTAVITKIADGGIEYVFTPESDGKPLHPLTLIVGFPRPIQLRRLLRDAAGLGVRAVCLTGTELGEKSYMQSNLVQNGAAERMLLDGTVQAAGTHVPALAVYRTLAECLSAALPGNECGLRLALDNAAPPVSLTEALSAAKQSGGGALPADITAAIGSERGWTDRERRILERAGFTRCGMGARILRTETAATVAAAVISASAGWLE